MSGPEDFLRSALAYQSDASPPMAMPRLMPGDAAAEYAAQRAAATPAARAVAERNAATDRAAVDAERARAVARPRVARDETSIADSVRELATLSGLGDEYGAIADTLSGPMRYAAPVVMGLAEQRYSPGALARGFGDALTFGNQGEIEALIDHNLRDVPYSDALQRREGEIARAYDEAPGSALAGTAAGLIPLTVAGGGLGRGVEGASRLSNAARMAAPAAIAGAVAGGVGGALAADDGERMEGAGRGMLRGGATGLAAGALGAAGQGIRSAAQGSGLLARMAAPIPAGALTGAAYGLAGVPGSAESPDASNYATHMGRGALIGGTVEPIAATLGAGLGLLSRRPSSSATGLADDIGSRPEVDEIALLGIPSMLADESAAASVAAPSRMTPEQIVAARRAEGGRSALGDAFSSLYEAPPAYDRISSVTANGPGRLGAMRSGAAAFGSPEALVEELQRVGIAPRGRVYSRAAEHPLAVSARDSFANELRGYHRQIADEGIVITGDESADRLEALADRIESRSTSPESQAAARVVRDRARAVRYADVPEPGTETTVEPLGLIDDAGAPAGELQAEVEYLGTPRQYTYPQFRDELSEQWNLAEAGRQSRLQTGSQTPSQRVAGDIYRAMVPSRDAMAEQALSPPDFANLKSIQRAFQATNAVSPVANRLDINAVAQPANLRGAMGGIAEAAASSAAGASPAESLMSRIGGQLRENLIANYQDSIRATANEVWAPAVQERLARMQIAPERAQRLAETLRMDTPGLAALAATRRMDLGDTTFGQADAEASSAIERAAQEGLYDDAGDAYLQSLGVGDQGGDLPSDMPTDPEEEAAAQRGDEILEDILNERNPR